MACYMLIKFYKSKFLTLIKFKNSQDWTLSYFTSKFIPEKRSRVCKGTITNCPVFGSGNSGEFMVFGAQTISCELVSKN